jgi:RsiW-degrading membrane proteinase PrsW (M82 family)
MMTTLRELFWAIGCAAAVGLFVLVIMISGAEAHGPRTVDWVGMCLTLFVVVTAVRVAVWAIKHRHGFAGDVAAKNRAWQRVIVAASVGAFGSFWIAAGPGPEQVFADEQWRLIGWALIATSAVIGGRQYLASRPR